MKRGPWITVAIALSSAVVAASCSLIVQIDDSKIPNEATDAASEASSDASDASPETALDSISLDSISVDSNDSAMLDTAPDVPPDVLPDVVPETVSDASIEDSSLDALDDGG